MGETGNKTRGNWLRVPPEQASLARLQIGASEYGIEGKASRWTFPLADFNKPEPDSDLSNRYEKALVDFWR